MAKVEHTADACVLVGIDISRHRHEVLIDVPGKTRLRRLTITNSTDDFRRLIERGRPGPGLLADVLVSKYADHLPLHRQSQIFDRKGLDLDRSALAVWVGKSTALLDPLADAIGRHVLSAEAIFAPARQIASQSPAGQRMIHPSACSHPAPAKPRPPASGAKPATSVHGAGMPRPQPGIGSPATGKACTQGTTSPDTGAGCMPMAMPGSRTSTDPGASASSPAWPISDASSSTSTVRRDHRSPTSSVKRLIQRINRSAEGHRPDPAALCCREGGPGIVA